MNSTMNPRELRADIPALQDDVYLNFGAHGPSPRYVVEAAGEFQQSHEYDVPVQDDPYGAAFGEFERTRERLASFIGADTDEIALTESTTAGINAVGNAIDWQPGDVVVRTDAEHPAGILPWQRLEREGVDVRVVETEGGRIDEGNRRVSISCYRFEARLNLPKGATPLGVEFDEHVVVLFEHRREFIVSQRGYTP